MTGAEHYLAAEVTIRSQSASATDLAAAQVHAQLAQAAATMALVFAQIGAHNLPHTPATEAWADVIVPER
jgi:hypothetical protein